MNQKIRTGLKLNIQDFFYLKCRVFLMPVYVNKYKKWRVLIYRFKQTNLLFIASGFNNLAENLKANNSGLNL
jgi:hypothetical protein